MMRPICFSILLLLVVARPGFGEDRNVPVYSDHSRLMVYLDKDGVEHSVRTPRDWAIRRRHILKAMEEVMGPLPDRSKLPPLDVRVTEEFKGEGFVRQTITFVAEANERVPAHLYLPDGRALGQRLPAMLALHPSSDLGKKRLTKLDGAPNRMYGYELARRGYVVIVPDYPRFGDYKDFNMDNYVSTTMKGIFNHMRAVDVLISRDEVDPKRIGVIGHSLGGYNAVFVGVFDPRLKVVVSSCGWTPWRNYFGGNIKVWASHHHMPLLQTKYNLDLDRVPFDFYEVIAALAPRAFFSNSPLQDYLSVGVKEAIPKVRGVYALFGAADRLQVCYPDIPHDFPTEVRRKSYAFIDQVLNHKPALH